MADIMTPEERSRLMARVRSSGTEPELRVRRALWHQGFRYRVNTGLPGSPDLVFRGDLVAIFIDGCFWHGCPLHGSVPKSNREFWENKLETNRVRDDRVTRELVDDGWAVLRFWEHEVEDDLERVVEEIRERLS